MKLLKCLKSVPSYRLGGWGSRTIKNELRTTSGRRVLLSDSSRLRGRQGKSPENPERFEGWPRGVVEGRDTPEEGSEHERAIFRCLSAVCTVRFGSPSMRHATGGAVLIAGVGKFGRRHCLSPLVCPDWVSSAGRSGGARQPCTALASAGALGRISMFRRNLDPCIRRS